MINKSNRDGQPLTDFKRFFVKTGMISSYNSVCKSLSKQLISSLVPVVWSLETD